MNCPCGFPRARFPRLSSTRGTRLRRRQERDQPQQFVCFANQSRQSALRQAIARLRNSAASSSLMSASSASTLPQTAVAPVFGFAAISRQPKLRHCPFQIFAQVRALADIEHVENRFLAQEHETAQQLLVLFRHLHLAQTASPFPGKPSRASGSSFSFSRSASASSSDLFPAAPAAFRSAPDRSPSGRTQRS